MLSVVGERDGCQSLVLAVRQLQTDSYNSINLVIKMFTALQLKTKAYLMAPPTVPTEIGIVN